MFWEGGDAEGKGGRGLKPDSTEILSPTLPWIICSGHWWVGFRSPGTRWRPQSKRPCGRTVRGGCQCPLVELLSTLPTSSVGRMELDGKAALREVKTRGTSRTVGWRE